MPESGQSPDSVDRALDRIDAARTRLEAADAAVASALKDLDGALDAAARLGPSDHDHLSRSAEELEHESDRMADRWQNESRHWRDYGDRWADFGQRIALHAQRLARREAAVAQREVERDLDHAVNEDEDDDGARDCRNR